MARRPFAVAEPPEDRRDQRVRVVEPGQLVVGEDRQRVVGKVVRPRDVALGMQGEIGEQHECSSLDVAAAGGACFGEYFLGLFADRRNIGEPPGGMRREVTPVRGGLDRNGPHQRPSRRPQRAAAQPPPPCFLERLGRRPGEVLRDRPRELDQQVGGVLEVVRTNLGELVPSPARNPRCEHLMLLGAPRFAHPAVRDVADQHVLEAIGVIARDARPLLGDDELSLDQPLEELGRRRDRVRAARARPARTRGRRARRSGGGCFSSAASPSIRAAISACRLSGMPSRPRPSRRACAISSRKSGFPSARSSTGRARPRRLGAAQERTRELFALAAPSGRRSIALAVRMPPPQAGRASSSSAARARRSGRGVSERAREMLDHVEQRLLRPVDVLEHEDERLTHRRVAPPSAARPS